MNNTTNAAKRPSGLRACADGLDANPDKEFAQKCMRHAADRMEDLETELAAVTEQRDKYHDYWESFGEERIKLKTELATVTEQRDQYKAALQSADNHNHEIATKLEIVTEQRDAVTLRLGDTQVRMFDAERQRDRLADLIKQFIYILDITEESDSGRLFHPTNITSCRAGDLQKAGELVEALRRASR